jgi:hypothetical protein
MGIIKFNQSQVNKKAPARKSWEIITQDSYLSSSQAAIHYPFFPKESGFPFPSILTGNTQAGLGQLCGPINCGIRSTNLPHPVHLPMNRAYAKRGLRLNSTSHQVSPTPSSACPL